MLSRWIFLGALLTVILIAVCAIVVLKIDLKPEPEKKALPVRERNFAEGVVVSQHGLYGVDLIKIGKAHMRKLRKGPFRIGAINELVLEEVELVLPESLWKPEASSKAADISQQGHIVGASLAPRATKQGDAEQHLPVAERQAPLKIAAFPSQPPQPPQPPQSSQTSPALVLSKLGLNPTHLRLGEKIPRFSALSISNLKVSRLEGTNAVPWFVARRAEAERGGLALEEGWSIEEGVRTDWKEAMLVLQPELRVITRP